MSPPPMVTAIRSAAVHPSGTPSVKQMLKRFRTRVHLSIGDAAYLLRMHVETYRNFEKEATRLNPNAHKKMVEIFLLSPSEADELKRAAIRQYGWEI